MNRVVPSQDSSEHFSNQSFPLVVCVATPWTPVTFVLMQNMLLLASSLTVTVAVPPAL